MVSQSTQKYSSLKKSTWPHLLMVGQTWSNLVKRVKKLVLFGTGRYNYVILFPVLTFDTILAVHFHHFSTHATYGT